VPPIIFFLSPKNASYTGGIANITIDVWDAYSGVNDSSVIYSTDNMVWNSTNLVNIIYYNSSWDASQLTNNQSVTLYANASDRLGNRNSTHIDVLIDNEIPKIFITLPAQNQILNGTVDMQVKVNDTYSGGDNSSVYYTVNGSTKSLNCSGTQNLLCNVIMDSTAVSDGTQTIYFYAKDNVKNQAQNSTSVIVDNSGPVILFIEPQTGSTVYGRIKINASVTDVGVGIDSVTYRWEGTTTGAWTNMDCSGSIYFYQCNASWNTAAVQDGNYVIIL